MLTHTAIREAARRVPAAAHAPMKVILFGFYARGDANEGSDLELLVVEREIPGYAQEHPCVHRALGRLHSSRSVAVVRERFRETARLVDHAGVLGDTGRQGALFWRDNSKEIAMQENVLRHLPSDENSVTTLLRALCVLKPIREIVARLFTDGKFGADDILFEGILTQLGIGGAIPDMCWQGDDLSVVVEIKVSASQGLMPSQPEVYLEWLAKRPVSNRFFVFLVPPHYASQHRQEFDRRIAAFRATNPRHNINFIDIHWLDLRAGLDSSGLSPACPYARDFQDLLERWFAADPIRLTLSELGVTDMFNPAAASAIGKIFKIVEGVTSEFERTYLTVKPSFQKRWWDGEYGAYLKCGTQDVLFFGLWSAFWKDHGFPLCIAVDTQNSTQSVISRFQAAFPDCVLYRSPTGTIQYLTKGINQHLLMGNDAIRDVSDWLLQGYLKDICKFVSASSSSIGNQQEQSDAGGVTEPGAATGKESMEDGSGARL